MPLKCKNKLIVILVLVPLLFLSLLKQVKINVNAQSVICDATIAANVSTADGAGNFSGVGSGDTVCIQSGARSRLTIENFHGTASNPITFINYGGQVQISNSGYAGIYVLESQHIRITGTGTSSNCGSLYPENQQNCGIRIDSTAAGTAGRGIAGESRTEYIEIDHVEIRNTSESGVTVKTKNYTRSQFTQHNTSLHHSYIHDITIDEGAEGVYIGSSDYDLGEEPTLIGVEIFNNLVARTGWDGIQVGSAVENCRIHHNIVIDDSLTIRDYQKSGMMINPGSVCDVYNNFLEGGTADYGIYVQGNGENRIYNNVILDRTINGGSGIKISTGSNRANSIYVWNNTIANMAEKGINFGNSYGTSNQIKNNIVVNTGGSAITAGIAQSTNNITASSVSTLLFVNPSLDDYRLQSGSPAIDAGASVAISTDFADNVRPRGGGFDVGAYEYQSGLTGTVTLTPTRTPTPTLTFTPTQTRTPIPTRTPTPTPINSADANSDGNVDGIDYMVWLNHYNQTVAGPANGDFNNTSFVDRSDFIFWLNYYPAQSQGEYFTVSVADESFCFYSTNSETIRLAHENYLGLNTKHLTGRVLGGSGEFNYGYGGLPNDKYWRYWSWHMDPAQTLLMDATIEICDGIPSAVEYGPLDTGSYCPWLSRITALGCPSPIN